MAFITTGLIGKCYRYQKLQFPKIAKPEAIGCFSLDKNHDYQNTAESFLYFRMPSKLPLDLNAGNDNAKSKRQGGDEKELLYPILYFLLDHQDELLSKKTRSANTRAVKEIDFIGFRGSLRAIMNTPYEPRKDWCIQATKFMGNIYFYEKKTDLKYKESCNNDNPQQKYATTCGLKFQQYCLVVKPNEEPVTNVPKNECEEFHCMLKTQYPGMTLLYGAVINGILGNDLVSHIENKDVLNTLRFMQLRCSLRPSTERQKENFRKFKCRKWWCQCFLAGIEDIMLGYRNENGLVDEIVPMDTQTLVELGANFWDPSQCVDFLLRFLQLVKDEMKDIDCPHTVYEFNFDPQSKSRAVSYRIFAGKSSNTFLPDWYVTELQNRFVEVPAEFEN